MPRSPARSLCAALAAALAAACGPANPPPAPFPHAPAPAERSALIANGGFETGDTAGWTLTTWLNNTGLAANPPTSLSDLQLSAGGANRTKVLLANTGAGVVPELAASTTLRYPKFGSAAALINQNGTTGTGYGKNANSLKQSYTTSSADIDPADGKIHVRFVLAPVLENPSHSWNQQPYFFVAIRNLTRGTTLKTDFNFSSQTGVPWISTTSVNNAAAVYTDWRLFDVAPGPTGLGLGETVELEVIASGCQPGGHFGEVLVDGFGSFIPGLSVAAAAPSQVNVSTNFTTTYTVRNDGTGTGTNVTVTQPIANLSGASFQSVSAPAGASCSTPAVNATTGNVSCNLGTVNPSSSVSFTVTYKAPASAASVDNGYYGVSADGIANLLGSRVSTAVVASGTYADLSLAIDDATAAVGWGSSTTWVVTVANAGPAAANATALALALPALAASASWSCAGTAGGATVPGAASGTGALATSLNLPSGGVVQCAYTAVLQGGSGTGIATFGGTIATPSGVIDPYPGNNSAADQDLVGTLISVTAHKDAAGMGQGTVVSSPAAISCGPSCSLASGIFAAGLSVTLTAQAAAGYGFTGWTSGPCAGSTANQCTFVPSSDTSAYARFDLPVFALTTSGTGSGAVACPPNGQQGQPASCTVTPAAGWVLKSLTDNGTDVTASVSGGVYTIASVTAGHALAAVFVKGNGTACGAAGECSSGLCVDGVCCNAACGGKCQACDVAGSAGTCTTVTSGQPHGARGACGGTGAGTFCGATCDGSSATACTFPGASAQCRAPSCSAGVETVAASCNGAGSCPALVTSACGAYACGAAACKTSCGSDADCASGNWCDGSSHCVPQIAQGGACGAANQCATGVCADGACCDRACSGQCEACDVGGHVGQCTTVASGQPHGARAACSSDGSACGGSCDGSGASACAYPGVATPCRAASCSGGVETAAASCAGSGSCPAAVTQACGATYACGATSCNTACAGDGDCAAGAFCNPSHQCVARKAPGAACGADDQCLSNACVDGVCCNRACAGQCEACDLPGSVGACTTLPAGQAPHGARASCAGAGTACGGACGGASAGACVYPGGGTSCRAASCSAGVQTTAASCDGAGACPSPLTGACGAYACGASACNTQCSSDGDCAADHFCQAGACAPKQANAAACAADDQCASGHCADGVCCSTACNGQCEACAEAGSAGTCAPVAGAPRGARQACESDGSACGGACDGARASACAYPTAATDCRAASCADGSATLAAACDGAGHCPAVQTQACGRYLCGAAACSGDCSADSDCSAGNWCAGGVCAPKLGPGAACAAPGQCGSGHCVDGLCCDSACDGQCEACAEPGHAGTCTPVAGAPRAARPACVSDGSACGGSCDGSTPRACSYPGAGAECRGPSCVGGTATLAAACDGAGACPAVQQAGCGRYLCGDTACKGDCAADADCAAGSFCAGGVCAAKLDPGASCASASQCASGFCTDGVCCGSACGGQCEACDVPGHAGACTPVAGDPHGARQACATDGSACGGACDGSRTTACTYPADAVSCRGASCEGGVATLAAACDGAGRCPAKQTESCGRYLCGAAACAGDCSADSDCAEGSWCAGGVCAPKLGPGALCGGGDQCQSGHCVDGVCCDSACDGQCEACAEPGHAGACTPVSGAPHGARAACASDGSACGGACDGARGRACAFPGGDVGCRSASCSGGSATLAAGCNGAGACPPVQRVSCDPFACGPTACKGDCAVDADCAAGAFCAAGVCTVKLDPGSGCSGANQCASAFCTDGVCCGSACNGQCEACDVPGHAGACTLVAGAPHGARPACASDGSSCGGACDGHAGAACAYPGGATSCRGASCSAGVATVAAACDGAGRCPAKQTQACGAYVCGAEACRGDCRSDGDCTSGFWCSAGVCSPKQGDGGSCGGASQCKSGFCVDGLCCNAACDGQCQACDVPGHAGACTPVAGGPHGARPACASDGSLCGGACDGAGATACSYPGGGVQCRAASCAEGVSTAAASCDGAGACPARAQSSCGAFACAGDQCGSGCTSDAGCASGSACVGGTCRPNGSAGAWLVAGSGGCGPGGPGSLAPAWGLALALTALSLRRRARRSRAAARIASALALALLPAAARAQVATDTQFSADRFQPGAGAYDVLAVGSARTAGHLDLHLSMVFAYARDPLRLVATDGASQQVRLLRNQTLLHLGFSLGLFDRFEVGAVLPVVVSQGADASDVLGTAISPGQGLGDLRVVGKARLLDRESFVLSAALPLSLPTGSGAAYLSQGTVTASPELRAESSGLPVRVTAAAGVALRGGRELVNLQLGNAFTWGLGGELPVSWDGHELALQATLAGELGLGAGHEVERPMELMAAVRWFLPASLHLTLGGGPGLTNGYGTPRFRVFAGFGFDPSIGPRTPPQPRPLPAPGFCAVAPAPAAPPPEPELVTIVELPPAPPAPEPAPPPAPPLPPPAPPLPPPAPVAAALPPPPPAPPAPRQVIRDGHVALLAPVQFAHDRDLILAASLPVLDGVAAVLKQNPDFRKVRVEGHTDAHGKPEHNRKLSQRRAEAVRRYLIKDGIGAARLEAKGYGPDRPIAGNGTDEERARNRRVEFVVVEGGGPAPVAASGAVSSARQDPQAAPASRPR